MLRKYVVSALVILAGVAVSHQASAAVIVGGSELLSAAWGNQLETWLDEGYLTLTKIYSKGVNNSTAAAFHAAADNQGRTFSIIQVTSANGFATNQIIGGYNPLSWDSHGGYGSSGLRDAFIFNLTWDWKWNQYTDAQTYNHGDCGPTFGDGHDIYVDSNLSQGYAYGSTYRPATGPWGGYAGSIVKDYGNNLYFGGIEVFTVETSPIPEPSSLLLVGLAGTGLLLFSRRRK